MEAKIVLDLLCEVSRLEIQVVELLDKVAYFYILVLGSFIFDSFDRLVCNRFYFLLLEYLKKFPPLFFGH